MTLHSSLERFVAAAELIDRCVAFARAVDPRNGHTLSDRIADNRPGLKAASYEGHGGSELWCWEHEQAVHKCHLADFLCDGDPIDVSDPIGEAALEADHGAADLRRIAKLAKDAERVADRFLEVCQRYPASRPPTEYERGAAEGHLGNEDPGCQSCERIGEWSPPRVLNSTVGGNLAEPMRLCRWCQDIVKRSGAVPSRAALRQYHAGRENPRLHRGDVA